VTDAYLLLGLLSAEERLAGSLALDPKPAAAAMGELAASLGLDSSECSSGVLTVLEAQVAKALRVVSVERGRDPRRYGMVAFGGAGPLHQGSLARELGCPVVIVPRNAGVLSAVGLLAAPVAVDLVRTSLREAGAESAAGNLAATWSELEADANRLLARQNVPEAARLARSADCRYRGQAHELEVPAPGGSETSVEQLAAAFEAAHRERYGYAHPGQAVEVVNLRVRAEGPPGRVGLPEAPPGRGSDAARRGSRRIVVDGTERECPVYQWGSLGAGDRLEGPAVVSGLDSTCLILPGQKSEVDGLGNLRIREG
jgi:N-methylhydantoinase A